MMRLSSVLPLLLCLLPASLNAQIGVDLEKEQQLQAATKQINQFFRRFNGEEGPDGKRYYPTDPLYQSLNVRLAYLPQLFDKQAPIADTHKKAFIQQVTKTDSSVYLNLHMGPFLAEVHSTFVLAGQPEEVVLYLHLQNEKVGSKWVMYSAFIPCYQKLFEEDTLKESPEGPFLHPLSHEIEFMNLRRAFEQPQFMASFLSTNFSANHLSMLLLELKRGKAFFKTVNEVSFHSLQVAGWYFNLKQFHREGRNSGWLIQSLFPISNPNISKFPLPHAHQ